MPTIPYETATITIATSTTISDQVQLNGVRAAAILFPAVFTGATISFQIPDGAGGWAALNSITLTKVVSQWVPLTLAQAFALGDDFRIVSVGAEAANRTLIVATRSV